MWLSIDHRDDDSDAARNLTYGAAEVVLPVLTRLSHSIPRPLPDRLHRLPECQSPRID